MMSSNKFFKMTIATLSVVAITGCGSSETSPYWGKEVAEFKVNSPSVEIVGEKVKDSFNLDHKANFNFRACLSDLTGGALPPGMEFAVQVGSGEEISARTDIDSCINWEREIGFSQLKPEKYYLLKTKFKSRNQLKGEITLDLLLNTVALSVTDMRDISASKRREIEEVKGDQVNIQNINDRTGVNQPPAGQGTLLPQSNIITGLAVFNDFAVTISNLTIERLRLNLDHSFSVDTHLNLTTRTDFRIAVSPKFVVRRFDNPLEEISPTRGQFKVTLAFMAEPDFSVDTLFDRVLQLSYFKDASRLLGTSKRKSVEFDLNLNRYLKEKENELNREMTLDDKRKLMGRLLLPFTYQTLQTQMEMNPQFGLQKEVTLELDQRALFPKRAMIAATVEPLGPEIKERKKADAAGIVSNLYAPSGLSMFAPYKIEADLIHEERLAFAQKNPVSKPLDQFQLEGRELGVYPANLDDVKFRYYAISMETTYKTQDLLQAYFSGTASPAQKRQFVKTLCHKIFSHESLDPQVRVLQTMRRGCETNPDMIVEIAELDFIESLQSEKAELVGPVIGNSISINQSFSRSASASTDRGSTTSANVGLDLSLGFSSPDSMKPVSAGFKASVGQSWYITHSRSKSTKGSSDVSLTGGFKISIESSAFEIQALSRGCVVVKANDRIIENFAQRENVRLPKALFVCDPHVKKKSFRENYYLIKQECVSSSPLADCSSDHETRFNMMIRGQGAFALFEQMVQDLDLEISLMPVSPEIIKKQIKSWETQIKNMAITQIFPGAILKDSKK